jgi:hypothetical protein
MTLLLLAPALISALLLAAHFLRGGNVVLAVAALAATGLAGVRRAWAARALQAGLLLASAEWCRTLLRIGAERRAAGGPWLRMSLILGAAAAVALIAALLYETPRLAARYRLRRAGSP